MPQVISTKTNVNEKVETRCDGSTVKTITTTTVETFSDGSTSTKTNVKTITSGPGGCGGQGAPSIQGLSSGGSASPAQVQRPAGQRASVTTDKDFLDSALRAHNEYRKKHHAPTLVLDDDLCQMAQAWANNIAARDCMQHSSNDAGENIYWSSRHDPSDGKSPVDSWYSEIKDYNFGRPGFASGTGHFTQVVWKGSQQLGIARATSARGGTYVVANYLPRGNFMGRFPENVLPA